MSDIYKEAECVVVWLGEGTEKTDVMMDAMKARRLSNRGPWRLETTGASIDENVCHGRSGGRISEVPEYRNDTNAKTTMVPENLDPAKIADAQTAIIHCGKKAISARIFAQAPSFIGLCPPNHCQAILDIMPEFSREESWWSESPSLQTLLTRFRRSEATDKRDIIYALLGLSSDVRKSDFLTPDYTKDFSYVIQDAISYFLFSTTDYQPLFDFLDWTLSDFLASLESLAIDVPRLAFEHGRNDTITLLLEKTEIKIDSIYNRGCTLLQRATAAKLLLEEGSKPSKLDWKHDSPGIPSLLTRSDKDKLEGKLPPETVAESDSIVEN